MLRFAEINTHFDFHGNLSWLILAMLLFGIWIWYTHRRAKYAPTTLQGLGVLWVLRGIAAILLLLLFFAPEVKIAVSESKDKSILFLVDKSASMPLAWDTDWGAVREQTIRIADNLSRNHAVQTTVMSNQHPEVVTDFQAIRFDGEYSVFPAQFPLKEIQQFSAVVAFTDGQFNVGQSPLDVEWLGAIPIYPLLPAKPKSPEGLKIDELIAPDFISASEAMPVQLTWRRLGNLTGPVVLKVEDESRQTTLLEQTVNQTQELHTFVSELSLSGAGLHRLQFQLSTGDGQFSSTVEKSVRVGKARQQVLLISDALTPLVTMIQRSLPDSLYSVDLLVNSRQEGFLLNKDPSSAAAADLIILIDRGTLATQPTTHQLISRVYNDTTPAIIFNLGQSQLNKTISGIESLRDPDPGSFTPLLTKQGSGHPLGIMAGKIAESSDEADFWASLPPLQSAQHVLWLDGLRIFDKIATPAALPAVTLDEQRPLLILNGSGYWRWFFRPHSKSQFNTFWDKAVTYLLNRQHLKLVSLEVQADAVHVGEKAPIFLQVSDVQGAPLDQGIVSLSQVNRQDMSSQSLELKRISAGLYRSELNTTEKGSFSLIGRVEQQGNLWGADSLSVRIDPFSAETRVTGVNQILLQRLAAKSGGRVIGMDDLDESNLPSGEYIAWHQFGWPGLKSVWLMLLLICVFGVEWAYRRRIGLM